MFILFEFDLMTNTLYWLFMIPVINEKKGMRIFFSFHMISTWWGSRNQCWTKLMNKFNKQATLFCTQYLKLAKTIHIYPLVKLVDLPNLIKSFLFQIYSLVIIETYLINNLNCFMFFSGCCERKHQVFSLMISTGLQEAFNMKARVAMQNPSHWPLRTKTTWATLRYWKTVSARFTLKPCAFSCPSVVSDATCARTSPSNNNMPTVVHPGEDDGEAWMLAGGSEGGD